MVCIFMLFHIWLERFHLQKLRCIIGLFDDHAGNLNLSAEIRFNEREITMKYGKTKYGFVQSTI